MNSLVGAFFVIWIEKLFILDYHEKNLYTKCSDSETSTREMNLKENSTDSKRVQNTLANIGQKHLRISLSQPNGECK